MKNLLLAYLILLLFSANLRAQSSLVGSKFQPNLKSGVYESKLVEASREFSKEVVVVRFIDPENTRINFELSVWENFISVVDTSLIGFVFYASKSSQEFQQQWQGSVSMRVPLVIDKEGVISKLNKLPEDPALHTLVLDKNKKVLTQAGSPIVNDAFNRFRTSIAKELQGQGYDRGVLGAIIDPDANNRTWFMGTPVYLLPNGETVVAEDAMKWIVDRTVYPQYSPLSDTVRLIKLR